MTTMAIPKMKVKAVGCNPKSGLLAGWTMDGEGVAGTIGIAARHGEQTLYGGRTIEELQEIYDLCKSSSKEVNQ